MERRQFLKTAVSVTASGVATATLPAVWRVPATAQTGWVRVYLVVVDGLRPDEVTTEQMPFLSELVAEGTFYPAGRAQMIAETTPNHVSMITGMRADRHGMPGNSVPAYGGSVRVGDDPRYLRADTLFTLARRQAPEYRTAAVTAKNYLIRMSKHDRTGDGEQDAGSTNDVGAEIPQYESTPDAETMATALDVSRNMDPDFLFVNLGDTDRAGHADVTGGLPSALPVVRRSQLQVTDGLLRQLVSELQSSGRWEQTVFIVTADHAMDWSQPDRLVSLFEAFAGDPLLAGEVEVALNGGAAMYFLKSPAEPRANERLGRMRAIATAHEGVEEALYVRPNPHDGGEANWVGQLHPDWGLAGDRTGDLVVTCKPGWRISDPEPRSNFIPGNHGHPVTLDIPVLVTGGYQGVRRGAVEDTPGRASNIDMAPTAAWLLGLNPPPGGFDGRVLEEAFSARPAPRVDVRDVVSVPVVNRIAGADRLRTAIELARLARPEGAATVLIASAHAFPDALAATPLAGRLGAALLLTGPADLDPAVAEEISRLGAEQAIVVGGHRAIGPRIDARLATQGVRVERLAGTDRYDTARMIAARMRTAENPVEEPPPLEDVILAVGERAGGDAFPDALAAGLVAGRTGRPILLTRGDRLPAATEEALAAIGARRVIVVGGTGVIATGVESSLRAAGLIVERLGGADRYDTGRLLAERAVREAALTDSVYLASGRDFPDALAAGAAVAQLGGLLLLVDPDELTRAAPTRRFLHDHADDFVTVTVVGGERAISSRVQFQVQELLISRRARTSAPQAVVAD